MCIDLRRLAKIYIYKIILFKTQHLTDFLGLNQIYTLSVYVSKILLKVQELKSTIII